MIFEFKQSEECSSKYVCKTEICAHSVNEAIEFIGKKGYSFDREASKGKTVTIYSKNKKGKKLYSFLKIDYENKEILIFIGLSKIGEIK